MTKYRGKLRQSVKAPLIFWTIYTILMLGLTVAWVWSDQRHANANPLYSERDYGEEMMQGWETQDDRVPDSIRYPTQSSDYVPDGVLTREQHEGLQLTCQAQIGLTTWYLDQIARGLTAPQIMAAVEDMVRELAANIYPDRPGLRADIITKTIDIDQLTVTWLMLVHDVLTREQINDRVFQICAEYLVDSLTE